MRNLDILAAVCYFYVKMPLFSYNNNKVNVKGDESAALLCFKVSFCFSI